MTLVQLRFPALASSVAAAGGAVGEHWAAAEAAAGEAVTAASSLGAGVLSGLSGVGAGVVAASISAYEVTSDAAVAAVTPVTAMLSSPEVKRRYM